MNYTDYIICFLATLGGGGLMLAIFMAITELYSSILKRIKWWKVKRKHSKPCVINCYCKDCKYYSSKKTCVRTYVVDNTKPLNPYWYCAEGELMDRDTHEYNEWRKEKNNERNRDY